MNETSVIFKNSGKMFEETIGFPGSICLKYHSNSKVANIKLLRKARVISSNLRNGDLTYIAPECISNINKCSQRGSSKSKTKSFKPKVLIFKNIFNSADKERNKWFSPGALFLASSLKKSGFEVILSDSKISLTENEFVTERDNLEKILKENLDLGFIGISLCEDFFRKAEKLIKFLRKRTKAFIGVGGVMPTLTPEHVFTHLSDINFLVRGAGEEIFPKLVKILKGKNIDSYLDDNQIRDLLRLKGLIFKNKYIFVSSSINKVNNLENFDRSRLDFRFLTADGLREGLNLFTSRGCFNNCFFCTSPGKSEYKGRSFQGLKIIIKDYHSRLKALFGDNIPSYALKFAFNDDDFLADVQRAKAFFFFLGKKAFRINFFQTGINSFFEKENNRYTNQINRNLLGGLSSSIFSFSKMNIYIGTENFSNGELKKMNKGYDFSKIEKVISILAKKKIHQAHHLILSNQLTEPEDILDNLFKIAIFRIIYGEYFNILVPIIPYLVSLYPSLSYKIALRSGREKLLNVREKLSISNYPEYDYPLVQNDIPANKITKGIIPVVYDLFLSEKDYIKILDLSLLNLVLLQEKLPSCKREIKSLIDKYRDYPELIFKKTNYRIKNDRNNLQLMITRRCQLRCQYCPIIKKNEDMQENVLYKAIDLLFTSNRDILRLDFTGGEPLLRFDLVQKGVEYAKLLSKKKNKRISFYLVTNLIALNDEMADFLAKEDFFLELSLDGKQEFHNLYKIGADPKINPYQLTASQLGKIFPRKINNYAVMVVSPSTAKYICSNFLHLLKIGFRRIGINYALGLTWDKKSKTDFFQQIDLVKKKCFTYIEKGIIKINNLDSRVEPAVLNSEIMVDVDGKVHFLTDWLFEQKTKVRIPPLGHITDFNNLNLIPLTKFLVLQRLSEYNSDSSINKTIVNNIGMGNSVKEYFSRW